LSRVVHLDFQHPDTWGQEQHEHELNIRHISDILYQTY
jgi:hypothetical protein